MRDMFFVSGLPRSGSTLLMNLLAQHPEVFCTPTSGLHHILNDNKTIWNNLVEHRADKNAGHEKNLIRVLKSILLNYHDTDKPLVVDKCRGWGRGIEMLEKILDKRIKILAPVRDVPEVVASFEMLYRKGNYKFNAPGPMPQCVNTEGRAMHWASTAGEVGIAYSILKDAFQRGLGDRFLLVDYDFLTHEPKNAMDAIWNFLEVPPIKHDFQNIINQTPEDDFVYNYVELHNIKQKIHSSKPKAEKVLGKNVCDMLKGYEFWKNN